MKSCGVYIQGSNLADREYIVGSSKYISQQPNLNQPHASAVLFSVKYQL